MTQETFKAVSNSIADIFTEFVDSGLTGEANPMSYETYVAKCNEVLAPYGATFEEYNEAAVEAIASRYSFV